MNIFVTPGLQGDPSRTWETQNIVELAKACAHNVHKLVDSPQVADVILITDIEFRWSFLRLLLRNPVYRRWPDKCYLYHEKAVPFPILPGLYTSMPASRAKGRGVAAIGYSSHNRGISNRFIVAGTSAVDRDLFYSFMGRMSHPVRRRLLQTLARGSDTVVENTAGYDHWDLAAHDRDDAQRRYASVLRRSRFALCPRGWATSSIRLYEAMQCAVVPVVISDEWLRPRGPVWEAFCVFVRERDISRIDEILVQYEDCWRQMGATALNEWERWFSAPREFHFLAESLAYAAGVTPRDPATAQRPGYYEIARMLAWASVHYPASAVMERINSWRGGR